MTSDPAVCDVLLAGCGDLNTQLGRRLSAQGYHVVGVRRRAPQQRLPFEVIQRDLAQPTAGALPAAETVVVILTADTSDAAGYEYAYRRTLHGLKAMLPQAPRRLIFVSSTGVLGSHDGQVVTEKTRPSSERDTARVLLEAEQDAAELFDGVTILRPAGIYGPGRGRLIERVRKGRAADHGRITNRIHSDDLVTALQALVQAGHPPAVLHAVDTEPAPMGEVISFLAQQLRVPVPPDSGAGTLHGKRIDGAKLHQMLGPGSLAFPTFRQGYAAILSDGPPPQDGP